MADVDDDGVPDDQQQVFFALQQQADASISAPPRTAATASAQPRLMLRRETDLAIGLLASWVASNQPLEAFSHGRERGRLHPGRAFWLPCSREACRLALFVPSDYPSSPWEIWEMESDEVGGEDVLLKAYRPSLEEILRMVNRRRLAGLLSVRVQDRAAGLRSFSDSLAARRLEIRSLDAQGTLRTVSLLLGELGVRDRVVEITALPFNQAVIIRQGEFWMAHRHEGGEEIAWTPVRTLSPQEVLSRVSIQQLRVMVDAFIRSLESPWRDEIRVLRWARWYLWCRSFAVES